MDLVAWQQVLHEVWRILYFRESYEDRIKLSLASCEFFEQLMLHLFQENALSRSSITLYKENMCCGLKEHLNALSKENVLNWLSTIRTHFWPFNLVIG